MKKYWGMLIVILCLILIGVGCSSKSTSTESMTSEMTMEAVPVAPEGEAVQDQAIVQGDSAQLKSESSINVSLNTELNRKIIKTGNMDLETKAFDETVNTIFEKVKALGGFVESCDLAGNSLYDTQSYRQATMSVRIPQKNFDSFMNGAGEFGNVVRRAIQAQDITDTYVDTQTRLKTLEVRRDRLLALLEKSGSLEELFKIEQELGNVTYEIETLKGTLGKYDALVDYGTVQINVEEVQIYQELQVAQSFGDKLTGIFKQSWQTIVQIAKFLILVIVGAIPYLVVVGIPVVVIVRVILKRRAKKS